MEKDNHEIEIKFELEDINFIRKILKNQKARFLGRTFERTLRFDTPNSNLEKSKKFLRVRTGFKNVITFKKKVYNKKFKEREEIELEITDPRRMEIILEEIGFTKKRIMEKYREKWILRNAEVVIDKLPFGYFIEIEGNEKEILKTVKILGLNFKDGITSTYWDLWSKFSKRKGIKDDNIFF